MVSVSLPASWHFMDSLFNSCLVHTLDHIWEFWSIHSWVNSPPSSPNIQPLFICSAARTEGAMHLLSALFCKPSIGGRSKCITETVQIEASELGGSLLYLGGDMDTHREQRVCARTLSIIFNGGPSTDLQASPFIGEAIEGVNLSSLPFLCNPPGRRISVCALGCDKTRREQRVCGKDTPRINLASSASGLSICGMVDWEGVLIIDIRPTHVVGPI